jgi:hypothetical protein
MNACPAEAVEARDHGPVLRAGRAVEDPEVLPLGALRVHADREARRVAIGYDGADPRFTGRVERHRIEDQHVAAVDLRIQLGLRLAAVRSLEELAAVLEQRRVGAVAVEIAGELLLHAGNGLRVAVEKAHGLGVLRPCPGLDLRVLAVLEPAIAIRQRRAVQHVDDRARRCLGREKWRRCGRFGNDRHDDRENQKAGCAHGHRILSDLNRETAEAPCGIVIPHAARAPAAPARRRAAGRPRTARDARRRRSACRARIAARDRGRPAPR